MSRYEITIEGVYENIYTIIDIYTGKEWFFLDLDFEQESDKPLLQTVQSICNLLNEKEDEIEKSKIFIGDMI